MLTTLCKPDGRIWILPSPITAKVELHRADILKTVKDNTTADRSGYDVCVLGCGINDVWRGFQGRETEAVDFDEYIKNYQNMVDLLVKNSRKVVCVGETPFGWDNSIDVDAANETLKKYNEAAADIASAAKVDFIDVWPVFTKIAHQFSTSDSLNLWSDGVHLSEYGVTALHDAFDAHIRCRGIIEKMITYELHERDIALKTYRSLIDTLRN